MIVKFLVKRYLHSKKWKAENKPPRLVKAHSKEEEVLEVQLQQLETFEI